MPRPSTTLRPAPLSPEEQLELRTRIAELEKRLSPSPFWQPEPGDVAQEGLLSGYRGDDGSYDLGPWQEEPKGEPLADLASGALHPTTLPQLTTCLRYVAQAVDLLLDKVGE